MAMDHANLCTTPKKRLELAIVVDDSALARKMIMKTIQDTFTEILQGEDGLEAVSIVEDLKKRNIAPNAIFLDSIMPKLSGIDACKQIRLLGYDGVIIAVTGNVLPADKDEFLLAGVDSVIGKPFQILSFKQTVAEHSSRLSNASYSGSHPSTTRFKNPVSQLISLHATGTGLITAMGSNEQGETTLSRRNGHQNTSPMALNPLADEEL